MNQDGRWQHYKKEAVGKIKICLECEHFRPGTKTCKICGCFMPAKVLIRGAHCPDNPPKW